jgi:hypothetical protein
MDIPKIISIKLPIGTTIEQNMQACHLIKHATLSTKSIFLHMQPTTSVVFL